MNYIDNPKTKGSGIYCAIPQTGTCPNGCSDCFFQSGRSYLEPLSERLPNMPPAELVQNNVVRVNDGNDSNIQREIVLQETAKYPMKFYNTAIPRDLEGFEEPVVLTLNPGKMTDNEFHKLPKPFPQNLMFLRFRTNTWNTTLLAQAVDYYASHTVDDPVPIVITFMAYYTEKIPGSEAHKYEFKKRTLNSYWVMKERYWRTIVDFYAYNSYVYTCGIKYGDHACKRCGHCLREYFATVERMKHPKD